ncbi:MAG: hypothetical protein A2104_07970 [Candidatus Melainabacteria bacterium GWF2_32_7]|nr:MAG: hypothetical protein A2104_07970 [Candidatus Melainabacteria bacterium GWF2_32_7]
MNIIKSDRQYKDLMKPGSFVGSTLTASGIKNTLIIFHGISGCNIEATHFRSDQIPGGGYIPVISTGLNEADCIQGGTEKLLLTLRTSINQAIAGNKIPEIVFVLTSDAASIVGDDIKTAARIVEEETGVKVIALDTPGFAGGLVHGTDAVLAELLRLQTCHCERSEAIHPTITNKWIASSQAPRNDNFVKNKINLIAPHLIGSKNWTNDTDEIIRLLQGADIQVNLNLCRNFDLNDISQFAEAKFNYVLSSEELRNFEKICSNINFDMVKENLPLPIGIANTEEWLLKFAQKLGSVEKAKEILVEDQKFVQKQLKFNYNFSWMSTLMYGKRCGILAHAKFGASVARCMLWDFGIVPKVIGLIAETDRAEKEALELLKEIENQAEFTVLINPSYFDYGNHLKQAEVDFAIGSIQDKPLCIGHKIPHLSLAGFNFFNQYNFIPFPSFGIRGVLGLMSELSVVMEEAFYLKNMISLNNYESLK